MLRFYLGAVFLDGKRASPLEPTSKISNPNATLADSCTVLSRNLPWPSVGYGNPAQ